MRLVLDLEPYMQYAYVAAQEAVAMSGLDTRSDRTGIIMGSALSGINIIEKTQEQLVSLKKGAGPKFLTKAMGNIAAAQFSINHGIQGPSITVSTACSSGGDAITIGAMMIRSGMADSMVIMAGEASINTALIQSLTKAGALSKTGSSLPFDADRDGFVLGEGGGAIVLESESSLKARGGRPIAELLGCANNTDAYNAVSPDPEGSGAAACMKKAIDDAGIEPAQIGYINAHGTATDMGDVAEVRAIHKVFGDHDVLVSSTKGMTGHMMGAGGITEVIACIKAVTDGRLPVNIGCTRQDERCDISLVNETNCRTAVDIAMSDAFGFGGQNSCIIVGRV